MTSSAQSQPKLRISRSGRRLTTGGFTDCLIGADTDLKVAAGYVAAAAVVLRLVWGIRGSRYARLSQFVRSPRQVLAYARALRAGDEPRYIGHNPLGGWMVLALWATAAALALTGWLYTTDWLWGYEWLSDLHAGLAWAIVALVTAHLGVVAMTSWRHRENLVGAMFSGAKRAPQPGDID